MKRLFSIILLFFILNFARATHNRAGEITYRLISGLTYEVTITTYTYAPSLADRCELEIQWGDGQSSILPRSNGPSGINPNSQMCEHLGVIVGTDIKKNLYTGTHTYPAPGTYKISLNDPNRNAGIVNIPSSVNVSFYIETLLIINPFLGTNSSPVLLNPPIDNACVGKPFVHNPGAYDKDGDSISYKLIVCKGENGQDIPGYSYPKSSKIFTLNPVTGDLLWDSPVLQGEYNVAMLISEWRAGIKIGSVIRDMQINVAACDNNPPVIKAIADTCIIADTKLQFKVTATDSDANTVTLTASGGPFEITTNKPGFPQPVSGVSSVSSVFTWQPGCEQIRKYPWQVVFRAVDNGKPINLVALKTLNITVVAPPIENLFATPLGNNMLLKWSKSKCENIVGYKIYRKNDCIHLQPSNCQTGIPANSGYTLIGQTYNVNDTTFTDTNSGKGLLHGIVYSYVVIAYYSDGAESLISNEACASLIKDVPVITNVSISSTDNINGTSYTAWSKPTQLDTNIIPGPYRYIIYRKYALSQALAVDSLDNLNDTIYNDKNINTINYQFNYRIDLYSVKPGKRLRIGSTTEATSIFLSIQPADNELHLSWSLNVPWNNDKFIIFRKKPGSSQFDSLTWTDKLNHTDKGLANGEEYCYYIKSIGKYSDPGIINPIVNLSQQACSSPVDNTSPCAPKLYIKTDCNISENTLAWTNPNNSCADDVVSYNIWYSSTDKKDFTILQTPLLNADDTIYIHQNLPSIAGCYAVMAVDSFGNKSPFSNVVCIDIDSCSLYMLPDIFTPNNDASNNLYIPFPYHYVESVDMKIFNRWGTLVFQTKDPLIKWDGKDMNSKKDCTDGVYFYICIVYEKRLRGLTSRNLHGTITIIR